LIQVVFWFRTQQKETRKKSRREKNSRYAIYAGEISCVPLPYIVETGLPLRLRSLLVNPLAFSPLSLPQVFGGDYLLMVKESEETDTWPCDLQQ